MKDNLKRIIALSLAVIMFAGSICTDNILMRTTAFAADEQNTQKEIKKILKQIETQAEEDQIDYLDNEDKTENEKESEEQKETQIISIEKNETVKKISDVDWGKIYLKLTDAASNKIVFDKSVDSFEDFKDIQVEKFDNYTYSLTSDNYDFTSTMKQGKIIVEEAKPKYDIDRIICPDKIEVGDKPELSVQLTDGSSNVWKDKISYSVSENNYAKINGNCLEVDELSETSDDVTVTITAKGPGERKQTKNVTICKKECTLDISLEEGGNWKKFKVLVKVVAGVTDVADVTVLLEYDDVKKQQKTNSKGFAEFTVDGSEKKDYSFQVSIVKNKIYKSGIVDRQLTPGASDEEFFTAEASDLEITYGETGISMDDVIKCTKLEGITGDNTYSYEISEEYGKIEYDETNKRYVFTPKKSGSIDITVYGNNKNYNTKAKKVSITVNIKKLSIVSGTVVAGDNGKKVYDGNGNTTIKAEISQEKLDAALVKELVETNGKYFQKTDDGKLYITNSITVDKNYSEVPQSLEGYFELPDEVGEKYEFDSSKSYKNVSFQVMKRPLYIKIGGSKSGYDLEKEYGSEVDDKALQNIPITFVGRSDVESGFANEEDENSVKIKKPELGIDLAEEMVNDKNGQIFNNVIYAKNPTEKLETDNYYVVFDDQEKGNLKINPQAIKGDGSGEKGLDAYSVLSVASANGIYLDKEHKLWYRGGENNNCTAVFKISEPYNSLYLVKNKDEEPKVEITNKTPFVIEKDIESYGFRLANVDGAGNIKVISDYFTLNFSSDTEAPEPKMEIESRKVDWNAFADSITFSYFKNKVIDGKADVEDQHSGVKEWKYSVQKIADLDLDSINTDEELGVYLEEKSHDIPYSEPWENGKSFNIGNIKENEEFAEKYLLFIRTEDNVGNSKTYVSNGMIFENVKAEEVSFEYVNETDQECEYLQKDTDIKVIAKEFKNLDDNDEGGDGTSKEKVFSGIAAISYEVKQDGKTLKQESGSLQKEDKVTQEELEQNYNKRSIVIDNLFTTENTSDRYEITASAVDYAGNETDTKTKVYFVDKKNPAINGALSSGAKEHKPSMIKYYNNDVMLTTKITERFLDESGIVYEIIKDGVTYRENYSLLKNDTKLLDELGIRIESEIIGTADTDENYSEIVLKFQKDGDFKITVTATDRANRSCVFTYDEFIRDTEAPRVRINYYKYLKNGGSESFTSPAGLDKNYVSFKTEIIVEEKNLKGAVLAQPEVDAIYNLKAKDSHNNSVAKGDVEQVKNHIKLGVGWKSNGTEHIYTFEMENDANYSFNLDLKDLAGNEAVFEENAQLVKNRTDEIILDTKNPSGIIKVKGLVEENGTGGKWSKLVNILTFRIFGQKTASASLIDVEDETSGVASKSWLVSNRILTLEELENRNDWTAKPEELKSNKNVVVYAKLVDNVGNTKYLSTENIVMDSQNPGAVIKIIPTSPAWKKGVYSAADKPGFRIEVEDPESKKDGSYSGLKEVTYEIYREAGANSQPIQKGIILSEKESKGAHKSSCSGMVYVDLPKAYSNQVWIKVQATDWSGNVKESRLPEKSNEYFKIDNKAPVVKFSFDKSDAQNGKYYKNDKRLTITVEERNFDISYKPKVTSSAGGGYSISNWSTSGETNTCVITFTGDSDYSVTFDCYDLAGNKSNTEKLDEFTVDKTNPKIAVSYDNNSSTNGKYYKSERTATITITEHNFDASNVKVITTANLTGKSVAVPMVSGWSSNGDMHTASIHYSEDGDYTFEVSSTDQAGNASDPYAKESFTVDKTNPEIKIEGVEDKSANKGKIAPVITLKDVNYDANTTEVTLTGVNRGRVDVNKMISRTSDGNGETINIANLAKDMDDYYTLTVITTDKAGNSFEKSIHYSANRNGSVYTFNNYTKNLLEKGYTNNPEDLVIEEMNVDTLEFVELKYSRDGKVVTLKENEDYTVKKEGGDGRVIYTYSINAKCFEEEGEYSVNIHSEDRAKNEATNTAKDSIIKFVVDKTSPTLIVTNLENNGRYKENSHTFDVSAMDNAYLTKVEYYLDDQLMHTYEGKELQDTNGEFEIAIQSKNQYQKVKLAAYDAAENPASEDEYRVLVTASALVQFYMNKPLFYGVILVILAAAGILVLIVIKQKRDEEKKIKLH